MCKVKRVDFTLTVEKKQLKKKTAARVKCRLYRASTMPGRKARLLNVSR